MIKARMEKLKVFKGLDDDKANRLKRLVIQVCRDKTPGLWWEPIRKFVSKTSNWMEPPSDRQCKSDTSPTNYRIITKPLRNDRHSGLIFKNVFDQHGERLHEGWMKDDIYFIEANGSSVHKVPLTIKEGELPFLT